jgi:hypothetical protein
MKTTKSAILVAGAALLVSTAQSFGVVGQAIQVQGTNLVLSWPSQGYEYYLIQYRPTLATNTPWTELTNNYPANSTNLTTFIIPQATPGGASAGEADTSGDLASPAAPMMAASVSDFVGLMAMPEDGSGDPVPLFLYPLGYDTSHLIIFGADVLDAPSEFQAQELSPSDVQSADSPLDGGSGDGGGDDPPSMGFYRVFHIPDWSFNVTNYIYDGPTFFPVDFKDYMERVDGITVLLNGEITPYAEFTSLFYNGQTNWGMGIHFDRLANGVYQIQLVSTLRLSDTLDDNTAYLVLSNRPANITVDNLITFTNWDDLIWNNTSYTFRAQTVPNVDWEIDIYDVYDNFVNYETGHSADGNIEWTWDLYDYWGNPRTDSDADPVFYPYITLTGNFGNSAPGGGSQPNGGSGSAGLWTPAAAASYPSVGAWVIAWVRLDTTTIMRA